MWMVLDSVLVLFAFLSVQDRLGEATQQCSVTFFFSVMCNGSDTLNGDVTESVMLQYRTSGDWDNLLMIPTDSNILQQEAELVLQENVTDFQLRWIQYATAESLAWFIDEIYITCTSTQSILFEELDRTYHNFWECSSGYVEMDNSACINDATPSHLLMNGTEREARTRMFNINSQSPLHSDDDAVSSCRECPLETVSSLEWPVSYVGTQLSSPCSINSVNITRTCNFNGSVAVWEPSLVDVFNRCRTGTPPAGAVCMEEITNSLTWPATIMGTTLSQFCLQTKVLIRRQCVYDGVSTYWYPSTNTIQAQCPNGTQTVSERVGMIANQINEVSVDEGIKLIQNFTSERDYRYPNDLVLVKNLTTSVLDRLEGKASKEFSEQFGLTMSDLLEEDAVNAISNSSETNQVDYVVSVLELTDRFALEYHDTNSGDAVSDNLRVTAVEVNDSSRESFDVFSIEQFGSITLNSSIFANMSSTGRAGGVFYRNVTNILPRDNRSNYTLESPVFSVVVNGMNSLQNESVVKFNLTHRPPKEGEVPTCAFYDLTDNSNPFWSDGGCKVIETTDGYTVCSCNHLTHFGVLFDARGTSSGLESGHRTALQVITYVGVAISLPLLLVTIICFLVLRSLWSLRTFVNINLCATLFIAQLIFVIGADKTSSDGGCATVAILLHFFFLTTFMWMLMEGVILYIMLVQVFTHTDWKYYTAFALISYGGPLLYMVLCIPLGLARSDQWSYGSDDVCWLTYDDGFIWAFIAPVILIILVNLGFMLMAMQIMYKHRDTAKSKKGSLWYWFKGCFTLIISMGITWVFGLLALHEFLLPLIYLFAIFTSLQGIWIFLLFIALSRPVHEAGKQWWLSTVSKSEILSTYHFKRTQSSFMKSSRHSTYASKKETSEISIEVKSDFAREDSMVKVETYDGSPKTKGRLSVSPTDSSSFKESSA